MGNNKQTRHTTAQWFEEGVRCFHKPDGVRALEAFEKVIADDPAYQHSDGDNPYFYLGKINEVEGRLERAIRMYTRALAIDPWDEHCLIGRGSCLTVLKAHERAIVDFKKVVQMPASARRANLHQIYYAIGENYRQQDAYEQALQWGQAALNEDPQNQRVKELVKDMLGRLQA